MHSRIVTNCSLQARHLAVRCRGVSTLPRSVLRILNHGQLLGSRTIPFCISRGRHFSGTAALGGSVQGRSDALTKEGGWESSVETINSHSSVGVSELSSQGSEIANLGLGGYTPVGLVQNSLEFLHVHLHLPWWLAIVSATVVLRFTLLPLVVKLQINAAKLNNIQPEMRKIAQTMKQYREAGNAVMEAQEGAKLFNLYQKHGVNPLKMFAMPMIQLPIFITFFMALRRMAQAPVLSMKEGGMFWFTDLTMADPTYILPLMACGSFLINIELGGEAGGTTNPTYENTKLFLRVMGVLVLPISIQFPTAMFMYWVTTSVFSTGQILLFKVPQVRSWLGIPKNVSQPKKL